MKTILIDINLLPKEYKGEGGIKRYETDFEVKVLPFDSSLMNSNGTLFRQPLVIN